MAFSILDNVRLSAVYTAVPKKEIRIEDELQYYENSLKLAERARDMIGLDRRRIAWPDITASDLCAFAARRLMHDAALDPAIIDGLIFVSQTPDYEFPATACILQHELGLSSSCAAFDVNQGCSGWVYGLWLAASLVSSGACANILLLAGDAHDRERDPANRITTSIFGDGGSASLIQRAESAPPMAFSLGTDGAGSEYIIMPAGRARIPYASDPKKNLAFFEDILTESGTPWRLNEVYMDGAAVFNFTIRTIPAHLKAFMERCGITPDMIDLFLPHQANKQIVNALAKRIGMPPEKTSSSAFSRYGNLSSASIPAVFCDLFGEKGNSGRRKILFSGFGVGLSWASCLMDAENVLCAPVMDYPRPEGIPDRAARIEYWHRKLKGKE